MGNFIDMTGQKFERLTVRHIVYERDMDGRIQWLCDCKCGNIKITTRNKLRNGLKSCGCYRTDMNRKKMKKLCELWRNRRPKTKELIFGLYSAIKENNVSEELMNRTKEFLEKNFPKAMTSGVPPDE